MGIGIILRDSYGEVLACLSSPKFFLYQSIVTEYWALWRALIFCSELGIEKALFEGDAQVLINAIKCEDECLAWFGNLVEEAM